MVSALLKKSGLCSKIVKFEKLEELAEISLKKFNEEEGTQFKIIEKEAFIQYSGGDARKLINSIELVLNQFKNIKRKRNYQRRCTLCFARNNGTLRQKRRATLRYYFGVYQIYAWF